MWQLPVIDAMMKAIIDKGWDKLYLATGWIQVLAKCQHAADIIWKQAMEVAMKTEVLGGKNWIWLVNVNILTDKK